MIRSTMLARGVVVSGLLVFLATPALGQTEIEAESVTPPPADILITDQQEQQVLSSELIGGDVLHPQGDKIGTLDSLLFDADQKIVGGVVSVGGFLGIGAKQVALSWDAFEVRQEERAVVVDLTKEQLVQAPSFKDLAQIKAEKEAERAQQQMQQMQEQQMQEQQPMTTQPEQPAQPE